MVYEGDTAENLASSFCVEHNLDEETQEKLTDLLKQQMAGVLPKIDENEDYGEEEDEPVVENFEDGEDNNSTPVMDQANSRRHAV